MAVQEDCMSFYGYTACWYLNVTSSSVVRRQAVGWPKLELNFLGCWPDPGTVLHRHQLTASDGMKWHNR